MSRLHRAVRAASGAGAAGTSAAATRALTCRGPDATTIRLFVSPWPHSLCADDLRSRAAGPGRLEPEPGPRRSAAHVRPHDRLQAPAVARPVARALRGPGTRPGGRPRHRSLGRPRLRAVRLPRLPAFRGHAHRLARLPLVSGADVRVRVVGLGHEAEPAVPARRSGPQLDLEWARRAL